MVSDDFVPGATGVGSHLQAIIGHLVEGGHRIVVVTSRRPGQPAKEDWQGAEIIRVLTIRLFGFYQAVPSSGGLKKILLNIRPDVIHQHYLGLMMLRVGAIAKRIGIPQVYTYHMTEDHLTQPWLLRPFRRLAAHQIVRWCNSVQLVLSVSRTLAAQLPSKGIATRIAYVSNPVRFSADHALPADPDDSSKFIVLFAGRLNPEKNIPFLLRSFAMLVRSVPRARLWIAGEGSQRAYLQAMARDLGIAGSVDFTGFLNPPALAIRYAKCSVFVLPSLVETQGLVAMEAMWFAKPIVVAESVVSARELVDEGVNGYCVPANADDELARVLAVLAGDPALAKKMGESGKQRAEDYRPEAIVLELEGAYRSVLPGSPSSAAPPWR